MLIFVDSENIVAAKSSQRYLKQVLANNKAYLAVLNKERAFNLLGLQIDGVNEVLLNIEDFLEPIAYIY